MTEILDKTKENLYSRQIGTYGNDAMKKIMNLKILILGLKGLGIEVAKNIILTGPEKIIIYDPNIVNLKDLGLNYYLNENDINKNRIDYSCINSLSKLNPFTNVEILEVTGKNNFYESLDKNKLDVIVETELISQKELISINEYCRKKKIKFIYGANLGLEGFIFSDFGGEHIIYDIDGEDPKRYMIKDIPNEENGKIIIEEEESNNQFNLTEGDYILFKNVKGMVELNDNKPRKIEKLEDNIIYINDNTKNYHKYEGNGDIYEYKSTTKMNYISYEDSIKLPFKKTEEKQNFTDLQENKLHENKLYLSIIIILGEYFDKIKNIDNLNENKDITEEISKEIKTKFFQMIEHEKEIGIDYSDYEDNEIQNFEEKKVYDIISYSRYNIVPICSLIGGYLSQEIIKVIGKYNPINQWRFFDFYNNDFIYGKIKNKNNLNSKYHDQIMVFGDEIQQKLSNLKIFACGAGAVGCELLKNLAFMGVSTGEEGCVSLSDFDYIEISNLNRQFLFNNENINQSKSKVACETIKKMNKDFKCKDYQLKVCKETENIFCPSFWESQDIIISGVDDNKARMYLNDQCFKYNKILINIGTSGVKARGDIVIPEVTFPLALDMNEREIDIDSCTIKKFPFKIEHCIQWSQNYFHILFQENVKIFNDFILSEDEFISNLFKEPENVIINKFKIIKLISDLLLTDDNIERSYKIIDIGVYLFYKLFVKSIEDVFKEHPSNSRINDVLFWSGARKKPYTLSLNPNDDMMYQFLISFNSIICQCLGIQKEEKFFNKNNFNNLLIEKFERYKLDKEIIKIDNQDINVKLKEIKNQIIKRKKNFCKLNQIEFEKDGLNNNHLEFIQACSDLRARNYSIKEEDKNKILMIVGKNIAAVPTTTSSIVGYISLQIINLLYTYDTENVVKNIFINLGLNIMDLLPQQKIEPEEEKISKYPSIEINGSKTCEEFLQYFKDNYNLEIFHLEINDKIIYDKRVLKDPQKIKKQVEKTKKKLENLYMEQIEISKEKFNLTEKKFEIKIFCRRIGEDNKIIETIYDFPSIKYILN